MTVLTQGKRDGGFVIWDTPLSRENVIVTVAAETTLEPGTVLGKITATGKYVPINNDATPAVDGSQTGAGVLYAGVQNAGAVPADFVGVIEARVAAVQKGELVWPVGSDEAAGLADLAAAFIIARESIP